MDKEPRTYIIKKSQNMGYGFIAGYEWPTMVKNVEMEGPSYGRLQAGDVIMSVNRIPVENVALGEIIKMIQQSRDQIEIKVRQATHDELIRAKNLAHQSPPKPSDPSPTRPKSAGQSPSNHIVIRELFKDKIRVLLEGGHSKLLKLDTHTTVGDYVKILNERLGDSPESEHVKRYFGLAITKGIDPDADPKKEQPPPDRRYIYALDEEYSIMGINKLPYARQLRLNYRIIHPPSNIQKLYRQSKWAFDYYYLQSCEDLKLDAFTSDIDGEALLKLSAIHLLEYVHSNHPKEFEHLKDPKAYLKLIKKKQDLDRFVPLSMSKASTEKKLKTKILKKLKSIFEEFNFEPGMQSPPTDDLKIIFLNYLNQVHPQTKSIKPEPQRDCSSSESVTTSVELGPSLSSIDLVPEIRSIESVPDLPSFERIPGSLALGFVPDSQSIDDLLRSIMLPPPPPPNYQLNSGLLTEILTEEDIEKLKVPPPPKPTAPLKPRWKRRTPRPLDSIVPG